MSKKFLKDPMVVIFIFLLLFFQSSDALAKMCGVTISPASARIEILGTIQFRSTTSGKNCNEPCYTWEIMKRAGTGSTIDANGLYTAGSTEGVELITVTDTCNGDISDAARVIVSADSDDEDNCPEPNLEPTITIGECDSGVENQQFENGCTMSDLIAQCAESARNHGKFVRCVARHTNKWKREGLLRGREKGAIQRCASRSDIPSTTTTTIIPSECTSDEACNDGVYCNGEETCDSESGICQTGTDPCEEMETCSEETKECVPESHTPRIELIPDAVWRSQVIALPLIMVITGHHFSFNETTSVEFSDDAISLPNHLVLSPTSILVLSLVNPADSKVTGDTDVTVTVTSTLDTGVVVATASLTVTMLPGF